MMKKLVSIALATMMAVSMLALTGISAFAESVSSPTAATVTTTAPAEVTTATDTTTDGIGAKTTVNGAESDDISYSPANPSLGEITFTYTGDGTFLRWETNFDELGLVEGTDYTITYNSDDTVTINFISDEAIAAWNDGTFAIDAIVDFDEEEETTAKTKSTKTTKKNTSSKSPNTGANTAVIAGGIALAGASIAVIAASKKKDAE